MYMNKAQREAIARRVAELADIAANSDIDAALLVLESVCSSLGIDPKMFPQYAELRSL